MTRPTWDEYFLALAKTASTRAACTRSQVGAVLVDRYNRVRSVGYNGAPAGEPHCTDGACPRGRHYREEDWSIREYVCGGCGEPWPCPDAVTPLSPYNVEGSGFCPNPHAEVNAIDAFGTNAMDGYTMYITREPCQDCIVHMADEGIAKAVWPDGELLL